MLIDEAEAQLKTNLRSRASLTTLKESLRRNIDLRWNNDNEADEINQNADIGH
jgi:hypothetical protein